MKDRLTQRQNEAYEFIRRFIRKQNMPPTLSEIGDSLGIASTNGVYKLLQALQAKGYIDREKHTARGLTLVDDAPDPVIDPGRSPRLPIIEEAESHRPEALRNQPAGVLTVDRRLLGQHAPSDSLLLRVGDDGMNGDGIRKGDLLVVAEMPVEKMANGVIAGVVVHDQILARRFEMMNDRIHLRPADRHYSAETFAPNQPECHIVGPVIALVRTFYSNGI